MVVLEIRIITFFFSSRRRHTRFDCDWSSDVCSSDLCIDLQRGQAVQLVRGRKRELAVASVFGLLRKFRRYPWLHVIDLDAAMGKGQNRSEERRVGKEGRSRWWPYH